MNEQDVKTNQDTSTDSTQAQGETVNTEAQTTDRAIPYSRFKEKVDQVKELERQVSKIKENQELSIQKTKAELQSYYEAELSRVQRELKSNTQDDTFDNYMYDDDTSRIAKAYEDKVGGLMEEINYLKSSVKDLSTARETDVLKGQVKRLMDVYPSMDEEHVYAIKKIKPEWSLEDCAEYSHNKWEEKFNTRWKNTMEEKKRAAKNPVFGPSGKINIKPEDKPKNMADARKMLLDWADNS